MKKLLSSIILLLTFVGIGFGIYVYSNPEAHEYWAQPSTEALAKETVESYMKVEKEGLALNLKSVAEAYENLKASSSDRIVELKFSLLVLIILLCLSAVYIFGLLVQQRKRHVTRV